MQLATALEILQTKNASNDPQYLWAIRFVAINSRAVLASIRDPRERTRLATETKQAQAASRRRRAVELRQEEDMTAPAIGERIAAEEGHPDDPYDERTVRRWLQPDKSSGLTVGHGAPLTASGKPGG